MLRRGDECERAEIDGRGLYRNHLQFLDRLFHQDRLVRAVHGFGADGRQLLREILLPGFTVFIEKLATRIFKLRQFGKYGALGLALIHLQSFIGLACDRSELFFLLFGSQSSFGSVEPLRFEGGAFGVIHILVGIDRLSELLSDHRTAVRSGLQLRLDLLLSFLARQFHELSRLGLLDLRSVPALASQGGRPDGLRPMFDASHDDRAFHDGNRLNLRRSRSHRGWLLGFLEVEIWASLREGLGKAVNIHPPVDDPLLLSGMFIEGPGHDVRRRFCRCGCGGSGDDGRRGGRFIDQSIHFHAIAVVRFLFTQAHRGHMRGLDLSRVFQRQRSSGEKQSSQHAADEHEQGGDAQETGPGKRGFTRLAPLGERRENGGSARVVEARWRGELLEEFRQLRVFAFFIHGACPPGIGAVLRPRR